MTDFEKSEYCGRQAAEAGRMLSRREFAALVGKYGYTAATVAVFGLPTAVTFSEAADAAAVTSAAEEALKKKAKFVLTLGMEGTVDRWPNGALTKESMQNWGCVEFKKLVQQHSGGQLYVNFFDGAPFGAQTNALRKIQQGVFQVGNCSSQNAAAVAQVWNVLDFPYQIGGFENMWKVMFSKEVAATVRKKSAEANIDILFNAPWLRWLEFGESVKDEIRNPAQLAGMKVRITASKLEQAAFKILPANPTPVAWPETFGALKSGAVDGIHVGPAPVLDAGLGPVVKQLVDVGFMYNNDATWISVRWLNELPPAVRDAVREAAFEVQAHIFKNFQKMLRDQTGIAPDSPAGVGWRAFEKDGLKFVRLSAKELGVWKDMLSMDRNKKAYHELIDRFGRKEFETVVKVANAPGAPEAQRWWKA